MDKPTDDRAGPPTFEQRIRELVEAICEVAADTRDESRAHDYDHISGERWNKVYADYEAAVESTIASIVDAARQFPHTTPAPAPAEDRAGGGGEAAGLIFRLRDLLGILDRSVQKAEEREAIFHQQSANSLAAWQPSALDDVRPIRCYATGVAHGYAHEAGVLQGFKTRLEAILADSPGATP